jgi:hypothetical protein
MYNYLEISYGYGKRRTTNPFVPFGPSAIHNSEGVQGTHSPFGKSNFSNEDGFFAISQFATQQPDNGNGGGNNGGGGNNSGGNNGNGQTDGQDGNGNSNGNGTSGGGSQGNSGNARGIGQPNITVEGPDGLPVFLENPSTPDKPKSILSIIGL